MDHTHHHKPSSLKTLFIAILLTFGLALIKYIRGYFAGSLALLGDAGHMGSDSLALFIAAFAAWLATKTPSAQYSYGLGCAEIMAAWTGRLLILGIAISIILAAIQRCQHQPPIHSLPVILVTTIGLIITILVASTLSYSEQNLNTKAAILHVIGDILGSIAALISGVIIYCTFWTLINPILLIFIGLLIIFSSVNLLRETLQILMENTPSHINPRAIKNTMCEITDVKNSHDLHIWSVPSGVMAISTHVDIQRLSRWQCILVELRTLLKVKLRHQSNYMTAWSRG